MNAGIQVVQTSQKGVDTLPSICWGPDSPEWGMAVTLPGVRTAPPAQGWGQKEDTGAVSEGRGVESGRAGRPM